jgi:DNA-binding NtrC family response regulator
MREDNKNISLLIIENSDDYIFSYNAVFNQILPLYNTQYVKTMNELQTKITDNQNYNIAISEVFIIGGDWRNILQLIENKIDKIIFTSAYNREFPPIKELIRQGYSFLEKPFENEALREKVNLKFT